MGPGTRITFTIPLAEQGTAEVPAAFAPSGAHASREGLEPARVLVVDDDPQTLRYIRGILSKAGYAALVTADHRELARLIRTERPALVLLDLMFDGADGIELMQRLPELGDLPVIFISGYGRDETIVHALESGAVDYVVKPFSPGELTARIGAALRRRTASEPFVLGDLEIDYERRRVSVAGEAVSLTRTEYELLCALSLNAGRVCTYDALLGRVWTGRVRVDAEWVRVYMKRLRRKLGDDAAAPVYFFNERGVGYRMAR